MVVQICSTFCSPKKGVNVTELIWPTCFGYKYTPVARRSCDKCHGSLITVGLSHSNPLVHRPQLHHTLSVNSLWTLYSTLYYSNHSDSFDSFSFCIQIYPSLPVWWAPITLFYHILGSLLSPISILRVKSKPSRQTNIQYVWFRYCDSKPEKYVHKSKNNLYFSSISSQSYSGILNILPPVEDNMGMTKVYP